MPITGQTTWRFPVTEITNPANPDNNVEDESLKTELEAGSYTEITGFASVDVVAGDIIVVAEYDPDNGDNDLTADYAAAKAIVADHAGEPIGIDFEAKQQGNSGGEKTIVAADFTADEYEVIKLTSAPLSSGSYLVYFTCQYESTNAGNDLSLRAHTNGSGTSQNRAEERFEGVCKRVLSTAYVTTKNAGQKQQARIVLDRTTLAADSTVILSNFRLIVQKLSDAQV